MAELRRVLFDGVARTVEVVDGRFAWFDGREISGFDDDSVHDAARDALAKGVEAVALCGVFSPVNPAHESRAAELIRQQWPRQEALFRARFGHRSRTIRSHWGQWCGYAEQACLLAEMGISMHTNFVSTRPSHGKFMTGSGRAVRFVSLNGAADLDFVATYAWYPLSRVCQHIVTKCESPSCFRACSAWSTLAR